MRTINSKIPAREIPDWIWYLYGFRTYEPHETEEQIDIEGLDARHRVRAFRHAGLAACISPVERQEFMGEEAETRLQDIAWLSCKAQIHQRIVSALMHDGSLFPAPFGTVFSSLDKLADAMESRRQQISGALQRLRGCREWSVQIGMDKPATVAARMVELAGLQPRSIDGSPGLRHLQQRRLKRQAARDMDDWLNQWQLRLLHELEPLSAGFRDRKRLLLEGLICNWAFLVADEGQAVFFEKIRHWQIKGMEYGLHIRIKGPWPPYSFCS